MHKRRSFLALTAVAMTGEVVLRGTEIDKEANNTNGRKRCLVIGAGLAGLAAASQLEQRGHEVVVLEARERIGGRVWTSRKWNDVPLDLGATWIHGVEDNPITDLADELKAKRIQTSYENSITYATSGRPLSDSQEGNLSSLRKKISKALKQAQQHEKDVSIRQAIATLQQSHDRSSEAHRMLEFLLNSEIEQEYSGSVDEMSAHWYDHAEEFDGEDELFVDGFDTVVTYLASKLDIRAKQVVQRIEWGQSPVKVISQTEEYVADHVIVTLPLGVLKSGRIAFSPALPPAKQQAIKSLGYGVLNKCYLKFSNAFWPGDVDWLEYVPAGASQWTEWVSFKRVLNKPILLGFNAAQQGKQIETLSDTQIVASAMETLKKIFGSEIPQPIDHQITRWSADPYSMGSYSFNALGSHPKMRKTLAAPLAGRLFFAGEATHDQYFGTTHGAYLSGLRCAQEI